MHYQLSFHGYWTTTQSPMTGERQQQPQRLKITIVEKEGHCMYIDALDLKSGPAKKMAPLGETHSMYFPSPHVVCKNLLSLGPFA